MFVQFALPYDIRNEPMTYEWVVYRAVAKMPELALVMPAIYWDHVDQRKAGKFWATLPQTEAELGYTTPTSMDFERLIKLPMDRSLLNDLAKELVGPNIVWTKTITERIPILEDAIREALTKLGPIEALLQWTNCPSAKFAAKSLGIPTIHTEIGPLRPPFYKYTAYFDFEGVNGGTDAERRWMAFRENTDVPILSLENLQALLRNPNAPATPPVQKTHQTGVALQCPDDSNILAFNRGFSNWEIVATGQRYMPGSTLVRPHPSRPEWFNGFSVDWDESVNSKLFLSRINSLLTINSSLGFEAMLLGIPSYILGDAPFRFASWDVHTQSPILSEDSMLRWINWFVFGYLIPFERLFDQDYYRYRLNNPSEKDIYQENYNYWTR